MTFNQLKKNLKKDVSGFKTIKVAVLADSASQFICDAIKGYGIHAQINFDIYEADYSQIDLQVFDPTSELYESKPDFVIINKCTEKLQKEFYKKDRAGKAHFAEYIQQTTRKYYETITSRMKAKVIVNTFLETTDGVFGNYAAKTDASFLYQVRKSNLFLMDLAQQLKDLFVCDLNAIQSEIGHVNAFDSKMYVSADMVYSLDFLPYIGQHVTQIIQAVTGTFKKCLILDLDNTTWGGIIGDDGVEGIQVGYLGLGKVFSELQTWAKQLKERGIILAVCSKNTEEIAKEPFQTHPDMVLRLEDIAIFVANWQTKVENIRHIQAVLNIGFDSMVFLDDNPFEREMVKTGIPDVTVPELPEDPSEYLSYVKSLNLFETASYTEEDETRTKQYQEEAQRNQFQMSFENENDFLGSLEMVSEVKAFDDFSIPRVAQLTQRSNQFNLRTIRYTEEDLKAMKKNDNYITMSLTLEDKFGNHGLIGIIILEKKDSNTLFVDSWIMSCRVLKRGMERFTLNTIVEKANALGFKKIVGEYIPTKKNGLVKNHYVDLGFVSEGEYWVLDVASFEPTLVHIDKK